MSILKIDIHTHILPPDIPAFKEKFGYGGFLKMHKCSDSCDVDLYDDSGQFFRKIKPNCFDPEVRIRECAEASVRVQALSTLPAMFSYWAKPKDGEVVAQFLNDHIAEVVLKNPSKFVGLGTVPLQDPHLASKEAERCMKQLGMRGIQIGSHIETKNLSDPAFFEFYKTCEDLDVALFVHPWDMMGQDRMKKYWLPWLVGMPAESTLAICSMIFGGVFEKFPKLRVAFAHGGGSFGMTLGRIMQGFTMRPDLCAVDCKVSPQEYLGHFYVDSLVHDPIVLKYLVNLMGHKKICLGTDYPFPLGEIVPGQTIQEAGFDADVQKWLYYKSAANWLNIDVRKYGFTT